MNNSVSKITLSFWLTLALSVLPVVARTSYRFANLPSQTMETIRVEGESGSGGGTLMQRSNASQRCTVWLKSGEVRHLPFQVAVRGRYLIRARYSNDNFGPLDEIEFRLDNQNISLLTAQDTGDWGSGWNNFIWSPAIAEVELLPGQHTLSATVVRGDGVEIDLMQFDSVSTVSLPQVIEGENGEGDGLRRLRSNASQEKTIWLTGSQVRKYTFEVAVQTTCSISLRYSNDNYGSLDIVELKLDDQLLKAITLQDTGDWGNGWNYFLTSLITTAATLSPGTHTISVKVAAGDGFEIDMIKLDPQN